jgi:hypothetical protein
MNERVVVGVMNKGQDTIVVKNITGAIVLDDENGEVKRYI